MDILLNIDGFQEMYSQLSKMYVTINGKKHGLRLSAWYGSPIDTSKIPTPGNLTF